MLYKDVLRFKILYENVPECITVEKTHEGQAEINY